MEGKGRRNPPFVTAGWLVIAAGVFGSWGAPGERTVPDPGEGRGAPGDPAVGKDAPSRVMFAGYGWPEEFFVLAYQNLLDFLRSEGVVLRKAPGDREPDWMNAGSFEHFRENIRDLGADSLLYMRLDLGEAQVDRLVLRCYDEKGAFLWEEKTSGVMAMSYRGAVRILTKRMMKKLRPRIGRPGLPVDPEAVPPRKKKR